MAPPAMTLAGPVFVTARSAELAPTMIGVTAPPTLSAASGSGVSLDTLAVLVTEPVTPASIANVTVTNVLAPAGNAPIAHGKPLAQGGEADTNVRPAGDGSSITTF